MNKIISISLFYLILTTVLIGYFIYHPTPVRLAHGVYISNPEPITHFELMDNQGHLFSENGLKGHWSLLFFGFTSCEMICPLTLQTMKHTYERLSKSKRPQIIFISVDPERDSQQRLNQFVNQFNKHFIALRGPRTQINALQRQLHVAVSTNPMSHGTEILLINPDAQVQAYFYYPISAQNLLQDLNQVIT